MRFVRTAPGEELESIVDYRTIEFDDLIARGKGYDLFKRITLLMYEGLSPRAKNASNGHEYLKTIHPDIEWVSEYSKPVELYQERNGLTNFGGIEIMPSDVAFYLFQDELNLGVDEFKSENHYLNIKYEICEKVWSNKEYQDILMDEIHSIVGDIKKYEQITDIVLDKEFHLFSIEEAHIANDDDKFTISELSDYWGMTDANIRMAIKNRRFDMNVVEKRMGTYLIPKYEMDRIFGDYAIYNIKKIKKDLGFRKEFVSVYASFIERCVRELNVLLDFNIEEAFSDALGIRPIDPYETLKNLMVETLKSKDSDSKKSIFETVVKHNDNQRSNLRKLFKMDDEIMFLAVFERFIVQQNKANERLKRECRNTYLSINTDVEDQFIGYYKLNTRDGYHPIGSPKRYFKEMKFDVYGLSEWDIGNFGDGFNVGELHATFHNIIKARDDGMTDRLEKIVSAVDELSEDMYHMLFENGDLNLPIDINPHGNILYVHKLILRKKYDKPETIRLIMKNLCDDLDYLYDYNVHTLCYLIRYSDEEAHKYRSTFKHIGFKEIKSEEYSLLYFNTRDGISDTPIEKNEFSSADLEYRFNDVEQVIAETIVDGQSFYQLKPYYKGDVSRWVFREGDRTIKIQNRYNKIWIYERFNTSGEKDLLWRYDIERYSFFDICRIAIKDMYHKNHFYDIVATWENERTNSAES